jgi:hypothetical protein
MMDDAKFEGSVCLIASTLVLFSMAYSPELSPILAFFSLLGLAIYYLLIKKNYTYDQAGN